MSAPRESQNELSDVEREAIERQLEILLIHPVLNQSKRHQQLLKYIVTQTLNGNINLLKERTLGVDVFGRTPDYDTVKDPIVRVSVATLRKRLKTYYMNPENRGQVQITIPVGGYTPQFTWADHGIHRNEEVSSVSVIRDKFGIERKSFLAAHHSLPLQVDISEAQAEALALPIRRHFNFRHLVFIIIGISLLIALSYVSYERHHLPTPQAALSAVWSPIVISGQPPLCAIGQPDTVNVGDVNIPSPSIPQIPKTETDSEFIRYDDADALAKIVAQLQMDGVHCRVSKSLNLSLSDLRQGPNIFIGAFNNAWTLRLTDPLRFHFRNGPKVHDIWIEDKETMMRWKQNRADLNTTAVIDYAIVARFRDDLTNEPTLVVAGLGSGGTIAASQFVTDPNYLAGLARTIGLKELGKNFEVVIETELIDRNPGAPHIVASCSWN